ncbi:hypothetical protein C8J57DRAFT_1334809 [Mycena rebaudengoi]|nr:hypothetical protein C8J57DRAFT_1334809 [Mycena rebaudengoi]
MRLPINRRPHRGVRRVRLHLRLRLPLLVACLPRARARTRTRTPAGARTSRRVISPRIRVRVRILPRLRPIRPLALVQRLHPVCMRSLRGPHTPRIRRRVRRSRSRERGGRRGRGCGRGHR